MQSNYGALEFNWLLGRDIVQKRAESRWGSGTVNQLCLDLKAAYPDVKGFSVRNLYYMKEWYEFYMADEEHKEILHQVGAKLQEAENQNPIKLHQLGAEIVSTDKISAILAEGEILPVFGIVPWKHHLTLISKCRSIKEAFYFFFLFSKAFFCSLANLRSTFFTSSAGGRFSGTIPRCTSISRTAALLAICSWLIRLSP